MKVNYICCFNILILWLWEKNQGVFVVLFKISAKKETGKTIDESVFLVIESVCNTK